MTVPDIKYEIKKITIIYWNCLSNWKFVQRRKYNFFRQNIHFFRGGRNTRPNIATPASGQWLLVPICSRCFTC